MWLRELGRVLFIVTLAAGVLFSTGASAPPQPNPPSFVPGEVLIQFKSGTSDAAKAAARGHAGAVRQEVIHRGPTGDLEVARISGFAVPDAVRALRSDPAIAFAEPNWVLTSDATSNDPYYTNGSLWGMEGDQSSPANQYGSQAGDAWAGGNIGSSGVYVGVVDGGIDITHPDLAANVWTNPFEQPNSVDDDGNGYVDDLHGWNFVDNTNSVVPASTDGHGTHVAGTIGATGGNGQGVAGVNWKVTLISTKFMSGGAGSTSNAVKALDYLSDLKARHGLNVVATNNSYGTGTYSQALNDAVLRSAKTGVLVVAAAGNGNWLGIGQNNDSTPSYPANFDTTVGTSTESAASYDAVVSVAAINSTGGLPFWSNYGARTVHLGAPGAGINSTLPGSTYGSMDGTSMAAPHVTGALALYASANPGAAPAAIRDAVLKSALPTSSLSGKTATGGRLDVSTFAGPPPAAPSTPSGLSATPASSSQIDLSWTDNASNEDGFKVERSTDGGTFTEIATVGPNVTSYASTGLTASTTYWYRVRAYNAGGDSANSNTASATTLPPPTPPSAPSNVAATAVSSSQISLTWIDTSSNEDGFYVERSTGGGSFTQVGTVGANTTSYGDTGLSSSTAYTYRVRAHSNTSGDSTYSNTASATTFAAAAVPSAPTNLVATAASGSRIDLTWTDNASDESGFKVERSTNGGVFTEIGTVGANVTAYSDTGLKPYTRYAYRVRAYNASGDSTYSNTVSTRTLRR